MVRAEYAELERKNYGAAWTNEESRSALWRCGRSRQTRDGGKWSAQHSRCERQVGARIGGLSLVGDGAGARHQIDLERAFLQTMDELEKHIAQAASEWLALTVLAIVALPPGYFAFLVVAVVVYLALMEVVKRKLMARLVM